MMLEPKRLDDKSYRELRAEAIDEACGSYEKWTDRNEHDPGITLLEALCHLTELQRYFTERSAEPSLLRALLGARVKKPAPAYAYTELGADIPGRAITLPEATPIYADGVRFETTRRHTIGSLSVAALVSSGGHMFEPPRTGEFFPFGSLSTQKASFDILLNEPVPPGSERRLSVLLAERDAKREPDFENEIRPPKLRWEYLGSSGFEPANARDGTFGFISNGEIALSPNGTMQRGEKGFYVFRCTLLNHGYNNAPAIRSIQPNVSRLEQRHSLCRMNLAMASCGELRIGSYPAMFGDCLLFSRNGEVFRRVHDFDRRIDRRSGEAVFLLPSRAPSNRVYMVLSCENEYLHRRVAGVLNGFPNQRVKLETFAQAVVYKSFEILISEDFEFESAVLWQKTDSLYLSGPYDRHYAFDEVRGEIIFGDGFHGRMPKGAVMTASLELTAGSGGNIKAGRLEDFSFMGTQIRVRQNRNARGGYDREDENEAIRRASEPRSRAVTAGDFERLILQAPGFDASRVSAYTFQGDPDAAFSVEIAVSPKYSHGEMTPAYISGLLRYLEPFRLAGAELRIVPPVYIKIDISAEIQISPHETGIISDVKKKLREFFKSNYDDFGACIRYNEVFSFFNSLSGTEIVRTLVMRPDGPEAHTGSKGDITLERHCIAQIGKIDIIVSTGEFKTI